jgi:hypothetical protein
MCKDLCVALRIGWICETLLLFIVDNIDGGGTADAWRRPEDEPWRHQQRQEPGARSQ